MNQLLRVVLATPACGSCMQCEEVFEDSHANMALRKRQGVYLVEEEARCLSGTCG